MHEATHTSLDPNHLHTHRYQNAQKSDNNFVSPYALENPDREDLAESFAPWFITRYRKDQISEELYERITTMIPNRLKYLDSLNLDISPYQ